MTTDNHYQNVAAILGLKEITDPMTLESWVTLGLIANSASSDLTVIYKGRTDEAQVMLINHLNGAVEWMNSNIYFCSEDEESLERFLTTNPLSVLIGETAKNSVLALHRDEMNRILTVLTM